MSFSLHFETPCKSSTKTDRILDRLDVTETRGKHLLLYDKKSPRLQGFLKRKKEIFMDFKDSVLKLSGKQWIYLSGINLVLMGSESLFGF